MRLIFHSDWVKIFRTNIFGEEIEFDISLHGKTKKDFLEALDKWQSGYRIQSAFHWLTSSEREVLLTGIIPETWEDLFGEEECGEEEF